MLSFWQTAERCFVITAFRHNLEIMLITRNSRKALKSGKRFCSRYDPDQKDQYQCQKRVDVFLKKDKKKFRSRLGL